MEESAVKNPCGVLCFEVLLDATLLEKRILPKRNGTSKSVYIRRGITAKRKEATEKTMSVSTPSTASTASPIYKNNESDTIESTTKRLCAHLAGSRLTNTLPIILTAKV